MTWMHKIRLRVLAMALALVLAAIGAVSWAALPVWPVVGVAVAAAAYAMNRMTARLSHPVCWGCGGDILNQPESPYGVQCPSCGAITPVGTRTARADRDDHHA
jgi:predicted RNA-binding Zn-ribbon protein involved in translation (DUF1610 family)